MFLKDGIQRYSCGLALPSLSDATVFADDILPPLERLLGVTHVVFFIITIATLAAMAPHGSNDFVWTTTTITGLSGWKSPGLQWCIGLLTPAFSFVSFVGVLHMSESCTKHITFLEGTSSSS